MVALCRDTGMVVLVVAHSATDDDSVQHASVDSSGRITFTTLDGEVRRWESLRMLAREYWRHERLRAAQVTDDAANTDEDDCILDLTTKPVWAGCISLIHALIDEAADDDEIGRVAAGPIEDVVAIWGEGERFIDDIERRATTDPRWRTAVAGVWLDRQGQPDVNRRLAQFGARFSDGTTPE
ncbi:MAG: DUF6869 domain-containing protein [Jatrophihabitans sp.]|uniref:DUF6869 domain-containing protein n=1 Tax=Jatrophihabitans sp. TaxID=1932789 RepID=UPI003F81BFC8